MSVATICFDCDSTLVGIEGVDELAKRVGLGEEIEALTRAAMDGECPLDAVYGRRLALIRPDRAAIEWLAERYIDALLPGVAETIADLQTRTGRVHIVSGGIRQALLPLAERLCIPADCVHAVEVYFDEQGAYYGFDTDSPLAKSGGKAEICRQLKPQNGELVMIGDGQTDLETQRAGAYFIAFTGIFERSAVMSQADDVSADFSQLSAKLQTLVSC